MSTKMKPVDASALLTIQDIQGWYEDYPLQPSKAEAIFPLSASDSTTWKTFGNASTNVNEAADPISMNSKVPVAGRSGYKDVMGEMVSFGKGREWDADEIEKFEKLKIKLKSLKNPAVAQQLLDYYGNDLAFIRNAMMTEMSYLNFALISSACEIDFVAANSPYMQGIVAMDYGLETWQKNATSASWATASTLILADIQSAVDTGKLKGKNYTTIFINKKWFGYVRSNTQIQKYCSTLVANLFNTQAPPTLDTVNAMLSSYFDGAVKFEVIDEVVTRAKNDGTKVTANAFADGVAIFAQGGVLGHFEWNAIPLGDATKETYESFYLVGNYRQVDPSYSKIYAKGRGFPVVDTYADNFYLKINAVAWD